MLFKKTNNFILSKKYILYLLLINIPLIIFIFFILLNILSFLKILPFTGIFILFKYWKNLTLLHWWSNFLIIVSCEFIITITICFYKARTQIIGFFTAFSHKKELYLGKYKFLRHIAEGRMSSVYLSKDVKMDRFVALKTYFLPDFLEEEEREQFILKMEYAARMTGRLLHPNIAQISDIGKGEDNCFYFAREYINLPSLKDLIQQGHDFSVQETIEIVKQISETLSFASEENIRHGYLNPQDIFISSANQVILTDLGIADVLTINRLKWREMPSEEASFLAPEQIILNKTYTTSDIFALGIIFYLLITKRLPFIGRDFDDITEKICNDVPYLPTYYNNNLPALTDKIIAKMLQKDPINRYTDWDSLLYDLQNLEKEVLNQDVIKSIDEKWQKVRQQWTPEWEQELPLIIRSWALSFIIVIIIFILYNPLGLNSLLELENKYISSEQVPLPPKKNIPKTPKNHEKSRTQTLNFRDSFNIGKLKELFGDEDEIALLNSREWLYPSHDLQGTNYYSALNTSKQKREYKLLFSLPIKIKQIFTADIDGDPIPEIIAYAHPFINVFDFYGNTRFKVKFNEEINIGMLADTDEDNAKEIIIGAKFSNIIIYDFLEETKTVIPLPQYSPASVYVLGLIDSKYIIAGTGDRIFKISIENPKTVWTYTLSGILSVLQDKNMLVVANSPSGWLGANSRLTLLFSNKLLFIPNTNFFGTPESIILTDKGTELFKQKYYEKQTLASVKNIGAIWHIVTDLNHDRESELLCFKNYTGKETSSAKKKNPPNPPLLKGGKGESSVERVTPVEKDRSSVKLIDLKSKKVLYSYTGLPDSKWTGTVADFNYDNKDEIVLTDGNTISMLDLTLTPLKKIKLKGEISASGHLDNNKYPEILIINEKNLIILDKDLKTIKTIKFKEKINKAIITDINNDLQNEIIVISDKLYVYR